jgi:hypothetical protein
LLPGRAPTNRQRGGYGRADSRPAIHMQLIGSFLSLCQIGNE